jgi:hypothetical protein
MQNLVIPIISLSNPRSKSNSVWEGTKEIILRGVPDKNIVPPNWSLNCFNAIFPGKCSMDLI